MNTYSHVAPEVSREADRMVQVLWQDDEQDQADDVDQADELGTSESDDGQEDECRTLLLASLLGWHVGWYPGCPYWC
jgi:hypothetical protein